MKAAHKCSRGVARVALVVLALCSGLREAGAGTAVPGFTDTQVVGSLSEPTALAFLPDGRIVVTEKGGAVELVSGGVATLAGTIPVCTASEMGLLGVAVDPFGTNRRLYFYRTESAGGCGSASGRSNEVVRTTLVNDTLGSLDVLLTNIRTDGGNHDGGVLRIGPDSKLWVGVGDTGVGDGGAPGDSTNPYAQDLNEINGKILRLELDGSVPGDNPFVGQAGKRGEIFAYGFRNPFRMGFDPLTGNLWVGDVGQSTREEIDLVRQGKNQSWPYCEGSLPMGCMHAGDAAPAYEYDRSGVSASVTGGGFAVGGAYLGDYFFADFIFGDIYQAHLNVARDGFTAMPTTVVTSAGGPTDLVFGPDGALYYVAYFGSEIRRLDSSGFGPPPSTSTTTTTATTTSSTTTTLPACPVPTYPCVAADIAALLAQADMLGDIGSLGNLIVGQLVRAEGAVEQAGQLTDAGRRRQAKTATRKAVRALTGAGLRLRSRLARKLIDPGLRQALLDGIAEARAALHALGG